MTTAAAFRAAIKRCAANATADAPADEERRPANFIARLSASMESLGDHELDALFWGLLDQGPPSSLGGAAMPNPIAMPQPVQVWG